MTIEPRVPFVVAGCAATPAEPERPRAVVGAVLRSASRELAIGAGFARWIELELSRTRGEVTPGGRGWSGRGDGG